MPLKTKKLMRATMLTLGTTGTIQAEVSLCFSNWIPESYPLVIADWNQFERDGNAKLEADASNSFTQLTPEETAKWKALVGPTLEV